MEKIYIIDAVNFLFRSYYAIGPMTNKKGVSTGALYGFIRTLKKIIKDFSPNYLIAVFDGENNKMARQALYSEYKSHRKKAPDDLYSQIDLAYQFCEIANIPVISVNGVEADDTMATIAKWAKKNQFEVYLCTSDKDLCQMVDDQVFVLNVHKDNLLMNKEKVKEQFGVFPDKMLDYLAIVGDQSDNIPGIEGFGPKTAVTLLEQFSSLEDILANVDKVESKKRQEVLIAQKDLALLSKNLATLNTDVLIPQDKDSYLLKPQNEKLVEEFYQEMNFLTLLKEDKNKSAQIENSQVELNYKLITTEEDLNSLFNYLLDKKEIAIDTETTGLDPITAELVGIGLGVKSAEAFYIPFNGPLNKESILSFLKRLLDNENLSFYGHNLKYDYHILYNYGLKIKKICFDTLLASYVLNPQSRRHGLDTLALEKFAKNKIPITDLIGEGKKQISMQEVPIEMVCQYCCEDVDYTCRLKALFENEIKENKLEHVLYQIELPLIEVLFKMERSGIFIDKEIFAKLSSEFTQQLKEIEHEIFKEVGKPFNINSPKQLGQILYVDLGLTLPGKKGSSFSTAADVLEKLQENSPLVRNILKYRGLQKLLSTYMDN
ncbi:MAG: DNA polymerase I, partial [Chlamydiae bacterium]|nr:DNA polymerase I [Chlamydiota bacterium]